MTLKIPRVGDDVLGTELCVFDTDALLLDACDYLVSGLPSELLRAIDIGVAHAVMSEKTFHELGWMSAKSARGQGVADCDLRMRIEREYLPRIPVVTVPAPDSNHWIPDAHGVSDPNDVEHVQVARLISARVILSHDRDLRRPGFAPSTRADYDTLVGHLTVVTSHREIEQSITLIATVTGAGMSTLVSLTSTRLNLKSSTTWSMLGIAIAGSAYLFLAPPQRRRDVVNALGPLVEAASAALERSTQATHALAAGGLITPQEIGRFEAMIGAYLARNPDSSVGDIGEVLCLNTADRQHLSRLLREHPSFELASQCGWAIGRCREQLETVPRPWRQRES